MTGTRTSKGATARGRWFRAGGALVGAAMCTAVAFAVAPEPASAQAGRIEAFPVLPPGSTGRAGVYVAPGVTAAATYSIVAPGGLLLGPDGTPIANATPVTYVNGQIAGSSNGPAPVQIISTPTPVTGTISGTPGNTGGSLPPGQYIAGSVDGPVNGGVPGLPPPVMSGQWATVAAPVQTISTPTAVVGSVPDPRMTSAAAGGSTPAAPPPVNSTVPFTTPTFIQTISTPTAVAGTAPDPFYSGTVATNPGTPTAASTPVNITGAFSTPAFAQTISTPTGVSVPANYAGNVGYAGGSNTSSLVGTPGSGVPAEGITYPSRGSTP